MSSARPHRFPETKSPPLLPPAADPPPIAPPALSPMAPYLPGQGTSNSIPGGQPFPIVAKLPAMDKQKRPAAKPAKPATTRVARPFSLEPVKQPALGPIAVAASDDEQPPDPTEVVVHQGPPFLISMLVHMLLVIVMALIGFREEIAAHIEIDAVYADTLGKQLLDNRMQSPESLDMQVDVPVLSFDLKPALDPLAAPPRLSDTAFDPVHGTANIEAPSIGLALSGREAGLKKALLPAYGGTATTEASVLAGLMWLKKQQLKDGGWSLVGPYPDGASMENRCAATALALLAFQGYGVTHLSDSGAPPEFRAAVERGWSFLLKMQNKDGQFVHDGSRNQMMYAQAQASIAICELYGMTKDEKLKNPAQLAINFAEKSQSLELGGWRYVPRFDSDLSVTGWYVMALQSGMMAGLEVHSPTLQLVNDFLDRVSIDNGTKYSYQIGGKPTLTMTAEALLCREYLGWKHDDPRLRAGIDQLLAQRIDYDEQNVYYWYYATQACHHMDGADWDRWNERMREAIPAAQVKTGADKGSWHSAADQWGPQGGRLYVSCMSIFMLESYYRHLPIYKWRLNK